MMMIWFVPIAAYVIYLIFHLLLLARVKIPFEPEFAAKKKKLNKENEIVLHKFR